MSLLFCSFQAKKNGADGIEFDVGYTSDGVAILIHDDTVDRTTDGTGPIGDMTLEQIRKLDASAKFPLRYLDLDKYLLVFNFK